MLTIEPFCAGTMCRRAALQQKNTDLRLMSWTRCQASIPVFSMRSSSGGLIPALLKAMSTAAVHLDGGVEQAVHGDLVGDVHLNERHIHVVGDGLAGVLVDDHR